MYAYELDKNLLYILKDELDNYKDAYHLKDYTDMIERFNVAELCPKYDVVFVDEAQDLSPIQWKNGRYSAGKFQICYTIRR